jgi:uncharacterized membrane protein
MPTVTFYSKPNCPLCDQARHHLAGLLASPERAGWTLDEVNILDDPALYREYRYRVPVVAIEGGVTLVAPLSLQVALLRRALEGADTALAATARAALDEAAAERAYMDAQPPSPLATGEEGAPAPSIPPASEGGTPPPPIVLPAGYGPTRYIYRPPPPLPPPLRALNSMSNGAVRNALGLLSGLLGVWVTLPWLAPVFAKLGWWTLADAIYTVYIFFCHQLPERAGSLFGYQVAWCWRNTTIYTTMFLAGVLYLWIGRRGYGPRWFREGISWRMLFLCSLPLTVDGFSHMFGLRTDNAWFDSLTGGVFGSFSVGDQIGTLNWWLRVLTGALFGVAAVAFAYPWMDRTLAEERAAWTDGGILPRPSAPLPVAG